MASAEQVQSMRMAFFRMPQVDGTCIEIEKERSGSLADVLLAIEEKRGALYMRQMSGFLIEKWNLHSDRLDMQSDDALNLVSQLLKL